MKRLASTIGTVLAAILAQGQDAPEKSAPSPLHIGIQGSPDHAHRTLGPVHRDPANAVALDARNRLEVPRSGFTGGLFVGYALSERFGLEAGLGYALRGWQWDLSSLSFGDQVEPRRGFIYQTNDTPLEVVRGDFHCLVLPLRATYTVGKGRIRSISGLGLSADLLMDARSVAVSSDERRVVELEGCRTFNLTAMVGTGLACVFGEKGTLRLEPTLRYGLLAIRPNEPIAERLWSAGLVLGYVRNL